MDVLGLPKVVIILGPTASGKTGVGIDLAKKYNGEIISADSRQVYKKMTIGTAKPQGEWREWEGRLVYMVEGIPHHLVDCVDPAEPFTVTDFKQRAEEAIKRALHRGKIPFLVGGTGLYIDSVRENFSVPAVPPQPELRRLFEEKSLDELVVQLKEIDPKTAAVIDLNNPRRVMRALEVVLVTGRSFREQQQKAKPIFSFLSIGSVASSPVLEERIARRIEEQCRAGLEAEVRELNAAGYDWNLPSMSSIGYREWQEYFAGIGSEAEVKRKLIQNTVRYARRQMTWFKRDKDIQWVEFDDEKKINSTIDRFLVGN